MTAEHTLHWCCLGNGREPCPAHGEGTSADAEAVAHTKETLHATTTHSVPKEGK